MSSVEINIVKFFNDRKQDTINFYNFISLCCTIITTGVLLLIFDRSKFFIILFILTLLLVLLLKTTIKRERPYKKCCKIHNNDITPTNENYSFPSLHVAGTTVLCLMLWERYNMPHFFIMLIPLCIISRMGLGVHYLSDCLGGFFIATFIYLFMKLEYKKNVLS